MQAPGRNLHCGSDAARLIWIISVASVNCGRAGLSRSAEQAESAGGEAISVCFALE
jgi:hypothetical protein